jgi:hypothetical protein
LPEQGKERVGPGSGHSSKRLSAETEGDGYLPEQARKQQRPARPEKIMLEQENRTTCGGCLREGELARAEARQDALEQKVALVYEHQARLIRKLDDLIPAVARLEVKAGVWGGVGGLLATLVTVALAFAARHG